MDVDRASSGNGDEDVRSDSDNDDSGKSRSTIVAKGSKVYAIERDSPMSLVDGRIDDIAPSNESKKGVTSSNREKGIKKSVERA